MVPSSETCSFCVSVQAVIYFCIMICLNGCQTATVCAGNDSWSDSRPWCEMSSVCVWNRALFLYYFTDSLNLFIYFYCSSPPQRAPIKNTKNPHTSWQFLTWIPWNMQDLHQLFFILDGLNMSIYTFFKMPLQAACTLYFTFTMWVITCQCSGEQPALACFRGVNSSDDKEHRRSTRWPTPAHFLFKSAPTLGSWKLVPARKGLPVVLCWLWLANSMLLPFPIWNAIKSSAWQQSGAGVGTTCEPW